MGFKFQVMNYKTILLIFVFGFVPLVEKRGRITFSREIYK